jgi:hypothetical protein
MRPNAGGETHFMRTCDGSCEAGFTCVCGVCTTACTEDAVCEELAPDASCMAVDRDAEACEGEPGSAPPPAMACGSGCEDDADCSELGAGMVCAHGACRERAAASEPPVFVAEGDADASVPSGGDGGCGEACSIAPQPLALLLVDTSGSMELKAGCTCTSPGCEECLPDCASGERNAWAEVVETLAGTLDGCEKLERTKLNGATFDLGYFAPYHAPRGVPQDDGILDVYRDRVRFGLATFDSFDTYLGAGPLVTVDEFDWDKSAGMEGEWSYNPITAFGDAAFTEQGGLVGQGRYPGCSAPYYKDTGVRAPEAEQGALVIAGTNDRFQINDRIQADLLVTRPYGGTPIAAALDDLHHFLTRDPRAASARESSAPTHIVLITDGEPDSDFRDVGCDCNNEGDPMDPYRCGGDPGDSRYNPAFMHCPYPTAEEAAQAFGCQVIDCDPVARVHVISYAVEDASIRERLDRIARAGGIAPAHHTADAAELRAALDAVLAEIASSLEPL